MFRHSHREDTKLKERILRRLMLSVEKRPFNCKAELVSRMQEISQTIVCYK